MADDRSQNKNNHASPLLSSGLSDQVMAQKVLTCLHRNCVRRAMEVKELKRHFRLHEFYCAEHGTKLKAQNEEEEEGEPPSKMQRTGDKTEGENEEDSGRVDSRKEAIASTKKLLQCEDCDQAKDGYLRCPQCEDFKKDYDIDTCCDCDKTSCGDCENGLSGYCDLCEKHFCGRSNCRSVSPCNDCSNMVCEPCLSPFQCPVCEDSMGCSVECYEHHPHLFRCNQCKERFHTNCWGYAVHCQACEEAFCTSCLPSRFCSAPTCRTYFCDSCGEDGYPSERYPDHFKCSDRNLRFCGECPPQYVFSCTSCNKLRCHACNKPETCQECGR